MTLGFTYGFGGLGQLIGPQNCYILGVIPDPTTFTVTPSL